MHILFTIHYLKLGGAERSLLGLLGRQPQYLFHCHEKNLRLLFFVPGWLLGLRRKEQFSRYVLASA